MITDPVCRSRNRSETLDTTHVRFWPCFVPIQQVKIKLRSIGWDPDFRLNQTTTEQTETFTVWRPTSLKPLHVHQSAGA